MRYSAWRKDILREIRNTRNRFICIFLIVALGVAFFAGIRATEPDMRMSADTWYDEKNLMDIRVVSTLGLTDEDVTALNKVEGVKDAEPFYSMDFLTENGAHQHVIKTMSLPESINMVKVTEGRMPESPGECLADSKLNDFGTYRIGDSLTLKSGKDEDISEILSQDTYTIVGFCISPYYLSFERESTGLGDGSVTGFVMIDSACFLQDYYTGIYVCGSSTSDKLSYSDEYEDEVDRLTDSIEAIKDERCQARYDSLYAEASEKIADAEQELNDKEAEADEKLADAAEKLSNAEADILDAKQKIADAEKEISDGEAEIADKEQEIADGEQKLADAETEIADGERKLTEAAKEIAENEEALSESETALLSAKNEIGKKKSEIETKKAELEAAEAMYGQAAMAEQRAALSSAILQVEAAEAEIAGNRALVDAGRAELEAAKAEYEEGLVKLTASKEEYEEGKQTLADARIKLEEGRQKLADAKLELADGKKELEDGEAEFNEKKKEYEDSVIEKEEKIAEAREKINDAKEELSELKVPEWYVLDRGYISSCAEYGENSERIGAIGKIFPVIFFLVAILVSLTTMTRMVEEQRTQIGTMKALGYSNGRIAAKYLLYSQLASVGGGILGAILGQLILPTVIMEAYFILYDFMPYKLVKVHIGLALLAGLTACACTAFATWISVRRALKENSAELMRPVAPPAGKRVFIENIGFIWKRLNFTRKSTIRNLLRYKKRFFMTVFGIAGCMGLLLVGFGLHDSIFTIIENQFYTVVKYDGVVSLNTDEDSAELTEYLDGNLGITDYMKVFQTAQDAGAGGSEKSVNVLVPMDPLRFENYVRLGSRLKKDELYHLPEDGDGVIISEKLSKLLGIGVGDEFYLSADNKRVYAHVSAITENYVYHYVYMSPSTYEKLFNEAPEYNLVYFFENEGIGEEEFKRTVLTMDCTTGISYVRSMEETIYDMMSSLNFVVYVLIISAGLLAFVVLYNLNNININERRRELATLKVLGFYDGEVSAYVYRENVLLTIIGVLFGVVFGFFLHRYVIVTAEIDMTMFGRKIKTMSYLYAGLMTILFSALVNVVMYFKLKKIDMIESLKSIE